MNDRERAICARVKLFREHIHWSQPDFADAIRVTRDKLASIEYERTPLRFGDAVNLCQGFDVNGSWLATGDGDIDGSAPILWVSTFPLEANKSRLFSEVYNQNPSVFQPLDWGFVRPIAKATPGFDPQAFLQEESVTWFQKTRFKSELESEQFARGLSDFGYTLLRKMRRNGNAVRTRLNKKLIGDAIQSLLPNSGKKQVLTDATTSSSVAEVKAQLPGLLDRLRKATAETGKKSELADFLKRVTKANVPLASVSRWLSGEREPGGEMTLLLLRWVELQERQGK